MDKKDKEKLNIRIPRELVAQLRALWTHKLDDGTLHQGIVANKEFWMLISVGILKFLELDETERKYYVDRLTHADRRNSFASLIEAAKAGALRREAAVTNLSVADRLRHSKEHSEEQPSRGRDHKEQKKKA